MFRLFNRAVPAYGELQKAGLWGGLPCGCAIATLSLDAGGIHGNEDRSLA